jgi:hypothetical protein
LVDLCGPVIQTRIHLYLLIAVTLWTHAAPDSFSTGY